MARCGETLVTGILWATIWQKKSRAKFTHVSPVWYQLKRGNNGLELLGKHDVDKNWINDVRQGGSPMIVPRVVLEGYLVDILVDAAERQRAIDLIPKECTHSDSQRMSGISVVGRDKYGVFPLREKKLADELKDYFSNIQEGVLKDVEDKEGVMHRMQKRIRELQRSLKSKDIALSEVNSEHQQALQDIQRVEGALLDGDEFDLCGSRRTMKL